MPTFIAIIIAVALFLVWATRRRSGAAAPTAQISKVRCQWERVDPGETRMLKEYRCAKCSEIAYGRGEALPASRPCRAG